MGSLSKGLEEVVRTYRSVSRGICRDKLGLGFQDVVSKQDTWGFLLYRVELGPGVHSFGLRVYGCGELQQDDADRLLMFPYNC